MPKKIDIIVEARTQSKRLPGKLIMKILDRPVIDLMIERLKKINKINDIIIATTTNKDDDILEKIAKENNIKCFRGEEEDVLGRVVETIKFFKTDIVVQITGDNPLVDRGLTEELISFFLDNYKKYDFICNDAGIYNSKFKKEFPMGLNTKVFKSSILIEVERKTKNPVDREHIVNYILKNFDQFKILSYKAPPKLCRQDIRLTLDYIEDFNLIKLVYENLYINNKSFSIKNIVDFLDQNPKIKNLNSSCRQKVYKY
jgi:spore coat polysaccharide biosynthesis protein SpsF (cytidylyltransferase family)